jgi:hypothetical protein
MPEKKERMIKKLRKWESTEKRFGAGPLSNTERDNFWVE